MEWKFCSELWTRSAGFPVEMLDTLRSDETCRSLDRVRCLERSVVEVHAELIAILRAHGQPEVRGLSRRLRRALRSPAETPPAPPFVGSEDHARWEALRARAASLRDELREAVDELAVVAGRELQTSRERLAALVQDPRVQRSAWISSRSMAQAFRTLPRGAGRPARRRALERHALLFVQRLAAKYPLLSDLGLCAWGRIDPQLPEAIRCDAGPGLVADRERFFEHWAIQALAHAMHSDEIVREHCAVRLSHGCALEARTLYYPIGHRANLVPMQVKLLGFCDGSLSLSEVRQRLAADPDREPLERMLEDYLGRGVLNTEIPVPTGLRPEQHLRSFLLGLSESCSAKTAWLAHLESFVALRDAMSRATSWAEELDAERRLDELFTSLTGQPASRGHGAMHGCRFLTYEDARRDVDVRLGGPVARDLEQLRPVIDLCRWIVLACVDAYERRYQTVFHRLAAGLDQVDGVRLMRETQWITETTDVEAEVQRQVQQAWLEHLGERATSAPILLEPEDFQAVVDALPKHVETDGPWIPGADVHSLSVLPAKTGGEGYQLVLGKLYKGVPLLVHPAALASCPARQAVLDEVAAWMRAPLIQFADAPATYHRSNLNLPDLPGLHEAVLPGAHSTLPSERTVRAGELVVTREGGRLWVQSRDGRVKCGLMALRWSMLQKKVMDVVPFPRLEGASHAARVTMGNWVLSRAQWRVPTQPLLQRVHRGGALAAARWWQEELGLPERIFVRSSAEPKAVYIDLRSSLFADVLVALGRQTDELTVVEMSPSPEHCAMKDADGRKVVSELRLTVLAGPPTV